MAIWTFFLPLQEILDLEEFPITTDRAITDIAEKKTCESIVWIVMEAPNIKCSINCSQILQNRQKPWLLPLLWRTVCSVLLVFFHKGILCTHQKKRVMETPNIKMLHFLNEFLNSLKLGEVEIGSKLEKKVSDRYSTQTSGALLGGKLTVCERSVSN